MKILYVANERRAAELAADALRDIAQNVTILWTGSLSIALDWIHGNLDVAAVIVEAAVQDQSSAPFVARVRGLGLAAPVIVVASVREGTPRAAHTATAADYVVSSQSLLTDLPAIVRRGLQRTQAAEAEIQATVEQEHAPRQTPEADLPEADVAHRKAEQQLAFEASAAAARLAELEEQHDVAMAQAEATRIALEEKLASQHAELTASRAAIVRDRDKLADDLRDAVTALERTEENRAEEAAAAADTLRKREAELGTALDEATAIRRALEYRLTVVEAARLQVERHASLEQAAADRQAELEGRLAREAAMRNAFEQKLAEAEAARQDTEQRHASQLTRAAADVAERQARFEAGLAAAAAARDALERRLAESQSALQQSEQRRQSEAAIAADELARQRAQFAATVAEVARSRESLSQQLGDAAATLEEARRTRAAETAAAAEHLARREAELGAMLADAIETGATLEHRLADADAARQLADERAAHEQAAAAHRLSELEAQLARETETRSGIEQKLAAAEAAYHDAEERHTAEQAKAAADLAERQARAEARLAAAAASHEALEQQLRESTAALERTQQDRAAETAAAAEHLARREAELGAMLADAIETGAALEHRLADADAARQLADERAAHEQAAAAHRLSELEAELAREAEALSALEHDLANAHHASEQARQRSLDEIAAMQRRMSEHEARLEERAVLERAAHERAVAEGQQELRQVHLERESLQQALNAAQEQLQRLNDALDEERASRERDRVAAEDDRRRIATESAEVRRTLDEVRSDFQAVARVASEHAVEVARLGTVLTERDTQLRELTARHQFSQQAAKDLTEIEGKLHAAVEAGSRAVAELQSKLDALSRELDVARSDRDALRVTAEGVPHLQEQLDQSRAEIRRHFEHTPYGICRLNRDGAIVRVNRGLARLLGYRHADELRAVDFATRVFVSGDDLRWLIERCLSSTSRETAETTWRRKDGSRRIVRLLAFAAAAESVEIIAEDVTDLRAMEERLRQAQRMEAVGRLASEVAATCDNLLRQVSDDGRQWLAMIGSDTAARRQGELLLAEVKRAASFLRQLAVYGEQQTNALEPVDVNQVLRLLGPVLKRVAGDDIEFVLPKTSHPIDVDVAVERLERILVNVASYARQRMPSGGRLRIELGRIVADRRFLSKYPNVRPGAHALITITEENSNKPSYSAIEDPTGLVEAESGTSVPEKPGLELGVLLELIANCGGHLWMAAEPSGNMVLKIRLPQRVSDALTDPHPPAARSVGERAMARLFGH